MAEIAVPVQTIASKIVYQNPWITIREDKTTTIDGHEGIYGYMESKNSVMVGVIDNQKRICLVKAFRYPSKTFGWELPGGGGENEDELTASQRELEEETGILAKRWIKLSKTLVCNGLMTEQMAICVATDISHDGMKEQSDEKFADIGFFTLAEIDDLIESGEINDGQTITGLFFVQRWLRKQALL